MSELAEGLRKAEARLGREINLTSYSTDEFRKRVAGGDHFLSTVLKGDLEFIKGERRDLDAIVGEKRGSAT